MSEDLHHIDDLFRTGIEGHEEAVPPAVWDGVSSDLDKKQAAYYKRKYIRLKRAAAFLFVLCFLSGVYIVYRKPAGKETSAAVKEAPGNPESSTSGPGVKTNSPGEQFRQIFPRASEGNKLSDTSARINGTTTTADTGGAFVLQQTPAQEILRQEEKEIRQAGTTRPTTLKNNAAIEKSLNDLVVGEYRKARQKAETIVSSNTPAKMPRTTKESMTEGSFAPAETERSVLSPALSFLQPAFFNAVDYKTAFPNLQALTEKNRNMLLQTPSSTKSKKRAAHGISLSAFVAPNMSFDRLEDDKRLAGPGRNRRDAYRDERHDVSFSGGLLLNYELSKNWSLQSGVSVTSSATSIAPKTVYAKADNNGYTRYELNCSSGAAYISPKGGVQPAVGDSAKTLGATSKLVYVTIPASVSYRVSMGRFSLLPTLGAGLNFLTTGKATTSLSNVSPENTTTTISGLKPSYVDAHIGIGVEYKLSQKLSLGIRPNAKLALTPINQETPVRSFQNFLNVETGVRIKF